MSRCFPFPPPGYDKKARPDDVNLIIKEKEKEKHKQKKNKDKKDKDKKERSERKDKEKSEGKHKDDKERKQKKHRDKKDKKKDKHKSSDEKKIVEGSLDNQNGDKILAELGKRVRNDDGAMDNQMVQKNTLVEQRNVNLPGKSEENSHIMLPNGENHKFGEKGLENGFVGNVSRENQNKVEGSSSACQLEKVKVERKKEGKEKSKDRTSDGKGDGKKNEDRDKNNKTEEKKRKKEKKKEKEKKERSKEEIKQRGSGDSFLDCREPPDLLKDRRDSQGNLPKLKEPQLNGFLHDNEIRPGTMSRQSFSSHQIGQNGSGIHSSQNILNSPVEKGPIITSHKVSGNLLSPQPVIQNARNVKPGLIANNLISEHGRAPMNNHVVRNGLIASSNMAKMEHGAVKNRKTDDKFPSSHPFLENGEKMMAPKIDKGGDFQPPDFNHKMEHKEAKINGMMEGKKHTSSKPSSAPVKAKEKFDISMKPPHPDSKYLSQILDIPKVEWPQFDDEEWLFGCKDPKRPKLASSSEIERTKLVWAEAIRLEPEDITALPYVIPY
ncbi:hypothetical protein BUALT_Bualt02G0002600 [Buddleja alternifolia]|uniref:Uncharacterized protein n=1 Tax=Buddleja alternifolia TaxID=168488 RepID=A0AAV6Y4R3_9LAMI|nr:hypothetical protein BUALT_Bualt02G0002600 [Buddleja alternifolia]